MITTQIEVWTETDDGFVTQLSDLKSHQMITGTFVELWNEDLFFSEKLKTSRDRFGNIISWEGKYDGRLFVILNS